MQVVPAITPTELDTIRLLFREYLAWLDIPFAWQGFEEEMAGLPGRFGAPGGALLLAWEGGAALGCVGVRTLPVPGACEVKRLYVREAGRGLGVGRALMEAALGFAAGAGYERALLDTLPHMQAAQALYRSLGFEPVPAYWNNQVPGILYFGKELPAHLGLR